MFLADASVNWIAFLGRLHPAIVHLPIAFVVLLLVIELVSWPSRWAHVRGAVGLVVGLTMLSAIASATFGWFLASADNDFGESALLWHRWTGVGIAIITVMLFMVQRYDARKTYVFLLLGCVAMVSYSAHLGGELTHGQGYLAKYAPPSWQPWLGGAAKKNAVASAPAPSTAPTTAPTPQVAVANAILPPTLPTTAPVDIVAAADSVVFRDAVLPIMNQTCISCHGPEKSKAKLRLDTYAGILKGGEGDACLVPGKSGESALVTRILEPLDEEEHMPPKGKRQPTPEQVQLLKWWVDAGASETQTVAELKPPAEIVATIATLAKASSHAATSPAHDTATSSTTAPTTALAPADPQKVAALAQDLKILITPLGEGDAGLTINASVSPAFGDAQVQKLADIGPNVRQLNLSGTQVTDAGLSPLAKMTNLSELRLDHTGITDAGLKHLADLPGLSYLNLVGTQVSDAGLADLGAMKSLRRVFLWQTKATPDAARKLASDLTDQASIASYQGQMLDLQRRIDSAHVEVNVGQSLAPVATTKPSMSPAAAPTSPPATKPASTPPSTPAVADAASAKPVNDVCPITGKPIDPTKTATYKGKTIAFCCDKCLAEYQKNTTPVLTKLGLK